MFKGIKGLLATLAIATGAWAQGNVWNGTANTDWYGDGSETEFTITTAAQLAGLAELVNGGNDFAGRTITLGADIILNNTTNWQDWATNPPDNEWTAIGLLIDMQDEKQFNGTFDGAGFAVSGVYINNTSDGCLGLFGILGSFGTIRNLGVVASYVKGVGTNVGGLVGYNEGTIENSYATGNIEGKESVGGLVGSNFDGTIESSYAIGNVVATGVVENSDYDFVGGLVGYNKGMVKNSYAIENVEATGKNLVGGLVGANDDTIENSYATGNVKGNESVGGLAGESMGTITNSYAIGSVEGNSKVGGLVGDNLGTVKNGYYDSETSNQNDDDDRGTPKTTAEMKLQATYDGWDFENIWAIDAAKNNGYPYHDIVVIVDYVYDVVYDGVYNETKSLSIAVVEPDNATNKTVVWSVVSGGATINGNNITFTQVGPVTIRATIANGLGRGSDYIEDFYIVVVKAPGVFGTPSALNTTYTPTLTLANVTPPTGYAWVTPATTLDVSKSGQTFPATYTDPSGNYNPATGNITVNISKANGTGTVAIAGWTVGQAANAPTVSGKTAEYGTPSYTYSVQGANSFTATVPTAAGSYTVKATFAETANYNEHTATANFTIAAIPTYAATVTNGTGGGSYAAGTSVTITANAPPAGQQFKNWSITPAVTFTAGSAATPEADFTMPAQAVTATAVYEAIPVSNHLITVTVEGNGIANASAVSAPEGTEITLTATPHEDNRFVRWEVISGGITLSSTTATTATFTMPENAVEVEAVFEEIPESNYLITVTVEGNGIANASAVSAPEGTEITLTAIPDDGNRFVRWEVISGDITLSSATAATATFIMPDEAVEVEAVFEEIQTPILPSQLVSGNKAVQTRNGINLTATSSATVEIFNLKGSLISRQNFASGVHAIQLGHLPKGMYIVKATFGNEKQVLRMPVR